MQPKDYPVAPQGGFLKQLPIAPIVVSRGCPFSCTYCGAKNLTGKKMKYRSVSNVIGEILLLYKQYKVREIHIVDDNFTARKDYVIDFCNEIIKHKLNLALALPNGVRIDSLDEEVLKKMEEAGFYSMGLGIESGTNRILKLMKKNITVELVKEKTDLIKKTTDINLTGFFIIGYITETEEEILKTIKFAKDLDLDKANFFCLKPFPGTEVWDYYVEKMGQGINWEDCFFYNIVEGLSDIPPDKLKKLQKKAMIEFYLRPKIILGLLNQLKSIDQLKVLFNRTISLFK